MSRAIAVIAKLRSLGVPAEEILEVVELMSARSSGAERMARHRERKKSEQETVVTRDVTCDASLAPLPSPPPFSPPTPPPISPTPTNPPKLFRQREIEIEFEQRFWPNYPRKVAKDAALKAFRKAREKASLDEIMAGLAVYRRDKPDYQDWAHAASWLNAGRWGDDYSAPADGNVVPINAPTFNSPEEWAEQLRARHAGKAS